MLGRPRLRSECQARFVPGEGAVLLWETGAALLEVPLGAALAPLLDGKRTAVQIIDALADQFLATDVYAVLQRLERDGYLREAGNGPQDANATLRTSIG